MIHSSAVSHQHPQTTGIGTGAPRSGFSMACVTYMLPVFHQISSAAETATGEAFSEANSLKGLPGHRPTSSSRSAVAVMRLLRVNSIAIILSLGARIDHMYHAGSIHEPWSRCAGTSSPHGASASFCDISSYSRCDYSSSSLS